MTIIEIILIGVALSMDAFAVSVGKGMCTHHLKASHVLKCGLWFGIFQALMPLAGYYLCSSFASLVESIDHWIAFILLALIGGNMIRESIKESKEEKACSVDKEEDYSFKTMLLLAIATSIDALATGVSFAFVGEDFNIWLAVGIIGFSTFCFGVAGSLLGKKVGTAFRSKAGIIGGAVLIAIGIKILLEHLLG